MRPIDANYNSMATTNDLSSEMEVDAFRRLFPLRFHERHLLESIRPDGRPLGRARDTTVMLGAVASANGSALAKIGSTAMLAAIKLEVMTPTMEAPDEGCIAIDFHMPPICSPLIRPGRPAEVAPVISKQLSDTILRQAITRNYLVDDSASFSLNVHCLCIGIQEKKTKITKRMFLTSSSFSSHLYKVAIISEIPHLSSGMIDMKELSLVSGKAAWMAYLDIYCLDADGALFDAALLSAVGALSHLRIPVVSLNDDGRIVLLSDDNAVAMKENEPVNKEKRKLNLNRVPYSLTCILHKNYILADPTSEEESIMETFLTVVLDSSFQLVSLNKPGGPGLAHTSAIQDCIILTRQRVGELQKILNEAISDMEID
ncbi:hypothetical protein BUALT_Bualt12G0016800 [Buddleja alternifolia]|uniref:Ribosomal RNA-processing protein 43 n=1 Tax=Buddleja alternifolia TaxID=168488 RepID=A0AAV6WWB5_9LAMI|nr:hypothetical protein BUALT_Bualt12G0016800 [Buddleja alternifolia]